jgi:RNA polymerase sigma-70 factor (ECF subfamily)
MLAGEESAFRECYEQYAPALMRTLSRVLRSAALAEEILQESFAAAFRNLSGFRSEARLSTWLTGIALRRALNGLRGENRRQKNLPPPRPDASPSPEGWLGERDATRKVLALLDHMDGPKRLAILLQAEGHSVAEIAEVTGEPRGTVLARLSRARVELAERATAAGLAPSLEWLSEEEGR